MSNYKAKTQMIKYNRAKKEIAAEITGYSTDQFLILTVEEYNKLTKTRIRIVERFEDFSIWTDETSLFLVVFGIGIFKIV